MGGPTFMFLLIADEKKNMLGGRSRINRQH
jgi:hypothetical protein